MPYDPRNRLSDIQEAETPRQTRNEFDHVGDRGSTASPTLRGRPSLADQDRRPSYASTTSAGDTDILQWEGFDSASIDDSIIQDEGEHYEDDGFGQSAGAGISGNGLHTREEDIESAALSKRAERILANAKKRLTVGQNMARLAGSALTSGL